MQGRLVAMGTTTALAMWVFQLCASVGHSGQGQEGQDCYPE